MTADQPWGFHNPVRIRFGIGRFDELGELAIGRTLVVTTRGATRRGMTDRAIGIIGRDRVAVYDGVESNPTVEATTDSIEQLRHEPIETIVAIGGGSAIDTGKALSLGLADPDFDLRSALSGGGAAHVEPIRLVAVPTTSGTGSEVTPFATLWDRSARRKESLAAPGLHPSVALLDPELTLSLPVEATIGPGLDALSQCFEAIGNRNETPITTALAIRGLRLIPPALNRLATDPGDLAARRDMMEAALLSGLAISQTRTALAHSMSYPITVHLGLPHGFACALTLPAMLRFNVEAAAERLTDAAAAFGVEPGRLPDQVIDVIRGLGADAIIRRHVATPSQLTDLADEMLTPGRADNNLRPAGPDDVRSILEDTVAWLFAGGSGR